MDEEVIQFLRKGLTSNPKFLPVWYRYDKQGSLYNDRCLSDNKYYYFYPSEISIIREYAQNIVQQVQGPLVFVDMGSGNSEKTRMLLDNVLKRQTTVEYMPVDISEEFLLETTDALCDHYGERLTATPIPGDYNKGIGALGNVKGNKLVAWLGGGFQNQAYADQVDRLQRLSRVMNASSHIPFTGEVTILVLDSDNNNVSSNILEKDRLVIALDITQDAQAVENAYLDPTDISAPLYLNAVWRLNREMGSNIDVDQFSLIANFCKNQAPNSTSYLKLFLKSKYDREANIPNLGIKVLFKKDECLYLHEGEGVSCKYTEEQIKDLARNGGFNLSKIWTDSDSHVALCCLQVKNEQL